MRPITMQGQDRKSLVFKFLVITAISMLLPEVALCADLNSMVTKIFSWVKTALVAIGTLIIVIGESGTIYTFYIFSTHFTNRRDPAFTVFVSKDRSISKIAMTNLEEDEHNKKSPRF